MQEIEERAEQILAKVPSWVWDGESLPVPIEDIADTVFGLLVRDVEDMAAAPGVPELEPGASLSGLLLATRGEIWVSASEALQWPPRRRFTIGHELGHWCMHREEHVASIYCRSSAVDPPAAAEKPERPVSEQEADAFAAALLMPARLVQAEYERDREFARLCGAFGASGAAMGRRLRAVI
jgi:uncharacterized protein DUF955